MEIKKSEKASLENKRLLFAEAGLIAALLLVYAGFETSTRAREVALLDDSSIICDEIDIIPITLETPPPAPEVPALPMLSDELEIVDDDVTVDLDFQSLDDTDIPVNIQEYIKQEVVEEEVEEEVIFVGVVEEKPTFNGGDANEFSKWVNARLVYPEIAKENGIAGDGYELAPVGTSELIGESVADFGEAIVLAIVLTLLTLAAILESWRKPFLVLSTIPMALVGVLWVLQLGGLNISIFVLLGCVMLIGVVVNPAVLIVDKASQLEKAGKSKAVAMCHGVAQTFRAVVMVIVASGLGMLPIALSTGIGAVNRIGIGAASVGGILVAGALTLLLVPFLGMGRR